MKQKILIAAVGLAVLIGVNCIISLLYVKSKFGPAPAMEASLIAPLKPVNFPKITGLHRINGEKELLRYINKHNNFEMDAFYLDGDFFIAHDEEELSALTLSAMLKHMSSEKNHVWLDIKGAPYPAEEAVKRLKSIIKHNNFAQNKIIVETKPESAKAFADEGFYTAISPTFRSHWTHEETQNYIFEVEEALKHSGALIIEGKIGQYKYFRDYFPNMPKILYYGQNYFPLRKKLFKKYLAKDPMVIFFVTEKY